MIRSVFVGCALAAFAAATSALAFELPPNDGFVTDAASVLSESEEAALETDLAAYAKETSNEIAVLLVQHLQGEDIATVATDSLRAWGVGDATKNNGILILFSYDDRQVFIVTGYGLEGAVPDLVAKGVIDEEMLPEFRDGEYATGLQQGIDALKNHIGGEYTADRYDQNDFGAAPFLLFMFFTFLNVIAAFLGRSKSWWLGGILGGVLGVVLTILYTWWISIPALVAIGLIFDYFLSKSSYKGGRNRYGRGGGFWTGGGGGSGGFGGFGGGSSGGGGAGGHW